MENLGKFLLAHDKNAIIVAFLAALLPIFYIPTGFIAAIVVGLVTLKKGPKAGFWVIAWVALPSIAMLALRKIGPFDIVFACCVGIWIFATLLHRYRAWSIVLGAIVLVGVLAVIGVHLAIPDLQAWWIAHLTAYMQTFLANSRWHAKITPAEFANAIAPMATGLTTFFFAPTTFS